MDFILMVKDSSFMFITGPAAIKAVTQEETTNQSLGGSSVHCQKSGVADLEADNDEHCIERVKTLLSYLPTNCFEKPPRISPHDDPWRLCPDLEQIVPAERRKVYDVHRVIDEIVDKGSFLEIKPDFARNLITGFARMDGQVIGIVANQPRFLGGAIDINASDKGSRFIQVLDAYNIPIVTLMDTPAFLPGVSQEHGGIIRHVAKMLLPWTWFSASVLDSSNVLISGGNLIKKVLFPAEVLPIVSVLSNMVHFFLGLPIVPLFLVYYQHTPEFVDMLWFPVAVVVQLIFTLGLSLLVAALTVHFRDLKDILGNVMTFWFFATPIIYPMRMVVEQGGKFWMDVNPMTHLAISYQEILFYPGNFGHWKWLVALGVASVGLFLAGYYLFNRLRDTFAEEV